jgi:hypothetical protein
MPRDDAQDRPLHRYVIGNESPLTDRDRANVQTVVDSWLADWDATADVTLAGGHAIEIVVRGTLTPDQQSRLSKEIGREAERIENEKLS